MELLRRTKTAYITVSIAMVILGIILVINPGISLHIFCVTAGLLLAVFGVVKILGYFTNDLYRLAFQFDLAYGIFALVMGMIFLVRPQHIVSILPTVLGILILVDGVMRIQTSKDAKVFGYQRWWTIMILGIAATLFGLLLILKPFDSAVAMMMLLGVTLLIDGVQNLWIVISTVKTERKTIINEKSWRVL